MIIVYLMLYLAVGVVTALVIKERWPEADVSPVPSDYILGLACTLWPFLWAYGLFCLFCSVWADICKGLGKLIRWAAGG